MIRKFLVLMAVTASAAMLSVAADAANTAAPATGTPAKPEAPAAAGASEMTQVAPKGPAIVIEAGKGTLISLQRSASTVFIANPTIADVQVKSPKLIYVTAKVPGETVLYAVDSDDHVLLNAPVRVEQDLTRMRETLSAVAPGENVNVSSVNNSVVLSGKVSSAGNAEKMRSLAASIADETKGHVINRLSVATPNQVNIRVKVAEVDRNVAKDLGLNWSRIGGSTDATSGIQSGARLHFTTSNPTLGGDNVLSYALGGASSQLLGTLNILANEGFLTTLAEPNLTATNGQPASFLAGGEFPVPVIGSGTAGTTGVAIQSVDFKKFGVSLDVTPTIIDAEHLSMRIRTGVSQLSANGAVTISGFTIPALTERTAETTVELGSGQSFLLGGLLQNNAIQNVSKVPLLGDIPVLGQLFRSESFQRNESELVIVVTPYLVKPTLTSLALPTDGFIAPHDAEGVISGAQYRQGLPAPAAGPISGGGTGLVGAVGFRLD